MNKSKKIIIYLILILFSLSGHVYSSENKIILKVNNEIITTVDILNEIKYLSLLNNEFEKLSKNKKIEIAKNSLIREKIKLIEISKFSKEIELKDEIFNNIIKDYFVNIKINNLNNLEIFLKKNNLKIDFVKKKLSIDVFWKRLIYEKFSKNVKINKVKIEENLKKKKKQKEYLLSEIIFTINSNEKLDQKTDLIYKKIQNSSFSKAAFDYSISDTAQNGGKLSWIKEDILSEKIKNELKLIKIGQYTKPIVIPGGFLILKVNETREIKKSIDLQKEIKIITRKITNEQLNQFANIYLNKLKKNVQLNEI